MFENYNIYHYAFVFCLVIIVNMIGSRFIQTFHNNNDILEKENRLIRQYLLNDSPLYGDNKPKIWIHTKYELNARKWKDFMSRNTQNLNQPYIHLTIQSIIDHCGEDFHVCLIDDDTFRKIIPSWEFDLSTTPEPMKSNYRELGMVQLIYMYGGMTLPDSFLCTKNMKSFYTSGISGNRPFVCENINRTVNLTYNHQKLFLVDTRIIGATKFDPIIADFMNFLQSQNKKPDFTSEREFLGTNSQWLNTRVNEGKINIVGGEQIGVKTKNRKQILIDDLFEDKFLDLDESCVGIYIPEDELLSRRKYQWFVYLNKTDIMQTEAAIVKYIKASYVDACGMYKSSVVKSKTTYL